MTKPIHAVLRKINGGNRMDGSAGWVYVTLFPDVLATPEKWIPADNSGSSQFLLSSYADTVPLDLSDAADQREYSQMKKCARMRLFCALIHGAFPHNWEEIMSRPMVVCLEWPQGGDE